MQISTSTKPWYSAKRSSPRSDASLNFAAGVLGATAITVQVVFLREFLSVLYGNEIIIGIILAIWMGVTGIGAFIGRRADRMRDGGGWIIACFLFLGILPLSSVYALRLLRHLVFAPGTMIDLGQAFYGAFILLFPFCFLSGLTFPLLTHTISRQHKANAVPRVYMLESLGSLLGGAILSIVIIFACTTFQILSGILFLCQSVSFLVAVKNRRHFATVIILILVFAAAFGLYHVDWDKITRSYLFPHQEILYFRDTPYGNVTVTGRDSDRYVYENGMIIASTTDATAREEAVHYAMVQHPSPRNVLLISGGISGLTTEILKYNVAKIDYVELNPTLTTIGRLFTPHLSDPRINVIHMDARRYIKHSREKYDVVIMNLPDPLTAQVNRFYTDEFFSELKSLTTGAAVFSLSLTSSADYLSKESRTMKSSILKTLIRHFRHIIIVPGTKDYVLASDHPLSWETTRRIEELGIQTVYVNKYYIDDQLLAQRGRAIMDQLSTGETVNRDFSPVAYYYHLLLWLSHFEDYSSLWYPIIFAVILIVLAVRCFTPVTFGMFIGGFSASALEILILLAFQIIYGYVYQMLGIIITAFMAGLAAGAYLQSRSSKLPIRQFISVQYAIALYSLCIPFLFHFLQTYSPGGPITEVTFVLLTFLMALLIGREFTLATVLHEGTVAIRASRIYGIDLIGSALGMLLVAALLVPLWGVMWVGALIALLNGVSGTVAFWCRKDYAFIY